MTLIDGENREINRNWISYMQKRNISVTDDLNASFEHVLIYEVKKNTLDQISKWQRQGKKVSFWMEPEEEKFLSHLFSYYQKDLIYKNLLYQIVSQVNDILVTLPYMKKELEKHTCAKFYVVPKSYQVKPNNVRKWKRKSKKTILIYDEYYQHLNEILDFVTTYPNFEVRLLGYRSRFNMNRKEQDIYYKLNCEIKIDPTSNLSIQEQYIKNSDCILIFTPFTYDTLFTCFQNRKEVFLEAHAYLEDYLVHGKQVYLFETMEELKKQFEKRTNHRTSSLADNGYDFLENMIRESDKLSKYF